MRQLAFSCLLGLIGAVCICWLAADAMDRELIAQERMVAEFRR